ncbi:MAG: hypothetical protein ACREFD_04355, partial [Stellaceae bacterium]
MAAELGLAKTCAKLAISFRDYLDTRNCDPRFPAISLPILHYDNSIPYGLSSNATRYSTEEMDSSEEMEFPKRSMACMPTRVGPRIHKDGKTAPVHATRRSPMSTPSGSQFPDGHLCQQVGRGREAAEFAFDQAG